MKILLIIGSPKKKKSTSHLLGNKLLTEIEKKYSSLEHTLFFARDIFKKESELFEKVYTANAIIISTPLYVDTLPYPLITVFEQLHANKNKFNKKQLLFMINNGFPEPHHNDIAVQNVKEFTLAMNWDFLGGLTLGMGSAYENFQQNKNVKKAIQLTAIAFPNKIPEEALQLMRKKLIPIWLYNFVANHGWKGDKLNAQPFKVNTK